MRVLTATIKADDAGAFSELMRTQLPLLRGYPGLRYAKLARRIRGAEQEVCLFGEWKDTASRYGFLAAVVERLGVFDGACAVWVGWWPARKCLSPRHR